MKDLLAVVAGLISAAAVLPYLADMLRGKTHPNLVTWVTWGLLTGIGTAAAIAEGATATAILLAADTAAVVAVALFGLKFGVKKYTSFDIACQVSALLGIAAWLVTSNAAAAVAVLIVIEVFGVLPTLRHAWLRPSEETWPTFAVTSFASLLTIFSLNAYGFVALAYPVYLTVSSLVLVLVIVWRRSVVGVKKAHAR